MEYNITYRQKDGGWQYIISYKDQNGKWRQKGRQGFRTRGLAKLAADERLEELKEQFGIKLIEGHDKITLEQFKKMFLKDKSLYVEKNTLTSYETAFRRFAESDNLTMADIGTAHIQDFVNALTKDGLDAGTIKAYIGKLNVLFKAAVKPYRIIKENPITDDIMFPKEKSTKKEVRALTRDKLNELLAKMRPEKDYVICLIASHCGLRIGEIIGLCLHDIDLKTLTLDVNKQWKRLKNGKWGFGTVKSPNSNRTVPIPAAIVKPLTKYLSSGIVSIDKRIFPEKSPVNVGSRLGIKFKRLGFDNSVHDLRHTYATTLIANGVDFKTVAELMGDTVKTVIETYSHFTEDMANAVAKKVNQIFF